MFIMSNECDICVLQVSHDRPSRLGGIVRTSNENHSHDAGSYRLYENDSHSRSGAGANSRKIITVTPPFAKCDDFKR